MGLVRHRAQDDQQGHLNDFEVSGNHPSLWWFLSAGMSAAAHVALAA
jgi:hypothetical protein